MTNPWSRKNPFMSMWWSGANRALGLTRSRATADARRQVARMLSESQNQMLRFWTDAMFGPPPRKQRKRR